MKYEKTIGFFIWDDVPFWVCRVFLIPKLRTECDFCSDLRFQPNHGAPVFDAVLRIEFVHDTSEQCEAIGGLIETAHTVVDCNKAHTGTGGYQFCVLSDLKMLSAQVGHILDNQGFYYTCFHQLHHFLPARAIEISASVAVILEEFSVGEYCQFAIIGEKASGTENVQR